MKRQWTFGDLLELFVQSLQLGLDECVAKAESSRSKSIGNGWIHFRGIASILANQCGEAVTAQYFWEPFIVGDVLDWCGIALNSTNNWHSPAALRPQSSASVQKQHGFHCDLKWSANLLEDALPIPVRIHFQQLCCNPVMFAHPNGVQRSEANLHICTEITGEEAADGILLGVIPSTVHRRIAFKWKVWLLCCTHNVETEKTMITEQIP